MFLKIYKPKTSSLRFKKDIYKMNYFKTYSNIFFLKYKSNSGKSKIGRTILWSKSNNSFNHLYYINNYDKLNNQLAIILSYSFYNKNSTFISIIKYSNNSLSYYKLINGLEIGSIITINNRSLKFINNIKTILGSISYLYLIPINCIISNIIPYKSFKSKYAKSSGTYLTIFQHYNELNIFILVLPTGEKKIFSGFSKITIGRNSNIFNKYCVLGKAGLNIKYGFKPVVRGVAMNPVDHPHGGRTKVNKPEVSPWGWTAKYGK